MKIYISSKKFLKSYPTKEAKEFFVSDLPDRGRWGITKPYKDGQLFFDDYPKEKLLENSLLKENPDLEIKYI